MRVLLLHCDVAVFLFLDQTVLDQTVLNQTVWDSTVLDQTVLSQTVLDQTENFKKKNFCFFFKFFSQEIFHASGIAQSKTH